MTDAAAQPDAVPAPRDGVPSASPAGTVLDARTPAWSWLLPFATVGIQAPIYLLMDPSPSARLNFGYATFVCLVPWLVFLARARRARTVLLWSYLAGVAFYLTTTSYLYAITIPGYVALAVYFGLFYALFGCAVWVLHRRAGIPLTFVVPVLWVMTEYLRSLGPLALPLLFLSHGLYRNLSFIQIADLSGALGVSFVVAMVNGLIADMACRSLSPAVPRSRLYGPLSTTFLLTAATLLYGIVRQDESVLVDGPSIAVIQGDYPLTVSGPQVRAFEKRNAYYGLIDKAVQEQPDLLLLPETPWAMILNDEFLSAETVRSDADQYAQAWSRECNEHLLATSRDHNVHVVIGAGSMEFFPHAVYPKYRKYNSAFVYEPHQNTKPRYDKVALVMFGEYTPFRNGSLHWLYRKLDSFNPFSKPDDEFSLTPGSAYRTFDINARNGQTYSFGIPICFEDLIPHIGRAFSVDEQGNKRVDFLLGISNDGWFNHSAVVAQHMAVCAYRAVENRVGIARAVNTACSGFIAPNGRLHDLVQRDGGVLARGIFDYSVAHIRMDPRVTFYSRHGDWLGVVCVALSALALLLLPWRRQCAG